jgi:hypothetical protein
MEAAPRRAGKHKFVSLHFNAFSLTEEYSGQRVKTPERKCYLAQTAQKKTARNQAPSFNVLSTSVLGQIETI